MSALRPFRFAAAPAPFTTPAALIETARTMEALGYSALTTSDHPANPGAADPLGSLHGAASVTTTLRIGTHVVANDFRNPVMLAQQAALLDAVSGGRFELGLGTGYSRDDYAALGIAYDAPGVRVGRLEEATALIKRLFHEETVSFAGRYYTVEQGLVHPKTAGRPHPTLVIGGGGQRILSLAGREADIVSFDPTTTAAGAKDFGTTTSVALAQQFDWVRAAAGARFAALELHLLVYIVAVTEQRRSTAEAIARLTASFPPSAIRNAPATADEVLQSPRFLIGTVAHIVEQLQALREQHGISYISFLPGFAGFADLAAFAPVVARLAGT